MKMILLANADAKRIPLANNSVNCVVTSPPYYGLRSYGIGTDNGEIGLEQSPDDYVEAMCQVFDEIWRVLREDGTVWLNLGDSYYNYRGANNRRWEIEVRQNKGSLSRSYHNIVRPNELRQNGLKDKDLIGIPWRVAFALQARGWWLRQDIIWAKQNPMPESVKDRCTKAHEYIFLLTKSARYWYDHEAIKEENADDYKVYRPIIHRTIAKTDEFRNDKNSLHGAGVDAAKYSGMGRNKRSVWTVTTKPYPGSHYATFPPDLIEPCILAGCPEGGLVLDPFVGSGTTCMVARKHRRNAIGLDLNFEYLTTNARERLQYGSYVPIADGVTQLTLEGNEMTADNLQQLRNRLTGTGNDDRMDLG